MPITIKIGDAAKEEKKPIQASISLQIKKTLDGNLLIMDHEYLDIVINPSEGKIITMPKPNIEKDTCWAFFMSCEVGQREKGNDCSTLYASYTAWEVSEGNRMG